MHTPKDAAGAIHTSIPEVMVQADIKSEHLSNIEDISQYKALGIGPGIGTNPDTKEMLVNLIDKLTLEHKIVLDADALNILAQVERWESMLPPFSIITPHPKEFTKLIGKTPSNSFEKIELAIELASKTQMYIVLKDSFTCIVCPDARVFYSTLGNPGLAKAGSGDTLTGLIASLLAQGYGQEHAAVLAVYIHARAGDFAKQELTEYSMTSSQLPSFYANVFKELLTF